MRDEGRRYRILGVLGQGGFGRVYKARLEGPQGFVKDVAVKLLSNEDAPETALQRFRDESRILGLIRDRAIVNVDPPTRLDGRWAVVMEYVEGASIHALRKTFGVIPPKAALGVIQEAARALDKVYRTPGPDGSPLRLLHRDIKPGNLQLTPSGELKILDFGIARAEFSEREAVTTNHIGGTMGYIAPERLEGLEGPEGDVYSLGVVLRVMLTGLDPRKRAKLREYREKLDDADVLAALELSDRMCQMEPEDRPSAREVEDLALDLAAKTTGLSLRRWAEQNVSIRPDDAVPDDLIGSLLTETLASVLIGVNDDMGLLHEQDTQAIPSGGHSTETRTSTSGALMAATIGSVSTIVVGIGFLLLLGGGFLLWQQTQAPAQAVAAAPDPVPAEVEVVPVPEPEPEEPPEDGVADGEEEAAAEPEPEPAPAPRPRPRPRPSPAPAPAAPAPAPAPAAAPEAAPAGPTYPVVFTSAPLGAAVYLNGKKVGSTPLIDHPLPSGSYTLKLVLGDAQLEEGITVGKRAPRRYFWTVGEPIQVSY